MITIPQLLREMNTGKPFTVTFITYDKKRKRGGDVRTIQARVITAEEVVGRPLTEQEKKVVRTTKARHVRNVALLVNGHACDQVRKLHIPLITQFNGEEVTI